MLEDCRIIQFPTICDSRGELSFAQYSDQIPFIIKRVYFLFNVPFGAERGAHGHKKLQQIIIAISGSFDIEVDDGINKKLFHLSSAKEGLYICPLIWRNLRNFSDSAVCLVLASEVYVEDDYFREREAFLEAINAN